jgi:hypothetical protein
MAVALVWATLLPAPAGATTPATSIGRPIDTWPGIVFVCVPSAMISWSFQACESIEKEAQRMAATGKLRIAITGSPTAPDDPKEAARRAGFAHERALSVVATFAPDGEAASKLSLEASARADANPGVTEPLYRTIYSRSAVLQPQAQAKDAVAAGRGMLEGLLKELSQPAQRPRS